MATIKILWIIITIILLIESCMLLNFFDNRGKKIIKVKDSGRKVWYVFFVVFVILSLSMLIGNFKHWIMIYKCRDRFYREMLENVNYIFFIVWSFFNILVSKVSNTITEKGIYIDSAFYRWEKIQGYRWVEENTIEFRIKTAKKHKNKKLEVDLDVNRSEVDNVLKVYIKEN